MLSTIKLALAATVAAATGSFALMPDQTAPLADKSTAAPLTLVSDDLTAPLAKVLENPIQDRRVTVRINGTLEDVIKWLGDNGVSFVLENKDLSGRKLTINLVNQPIEDAIAAIADALDVSYTKKGDIYAFGSTKMLFAPAAPGMPAKVREIAPRVWSDKDSDNIIIEVQKAIEEAHKAKGSKNDIAPKMFMFEHGKALSPQEMKQFELHMKNLGDHIKVLTPNLRELEKMAPMTDKERRAFEESMKSLHQNLKLMPKSIEGMKMSEKERKEFELEMKKLQQEMKALPGEIKMFKFEGDNLKGLCEKEMKALELELMGKEFGLKVIPPVPGSPKAPVALKSSSMKELMKSLTPDQKAKHERQGYLKLSDLSGAQKKMLGSPSGNFTISVNMDGQKLTIKNP